MDYKDVTIDCEKNKDTIHMGISIIRAHHTKLVEDAHFQDRSLAWLLRKIIADYVNNK